MKIITCGAVPPERAAFALARYSRSSDSLQKSLEWVKTHDSGQFLESFYFSYGHASIADLGHVTLAFEGISELAAIAIEDEQLWDGQQRSTRFQDFSHCSYDIPAGLNEEQGLLYAQTASFLLDAYQRVHAKVKTYLESKWPRPADMTESQYDRTMSARAFDNARYLLFLGMPTSVGQVTSIRTLERQIRRLLSSPYPELREIGAQTRQALSEPPVLSYTGQAETEPVAPTLARHLTGLQPDPEFVQSLIALAAEKKLFTGLKDKISHMPEVELTRCLDKNAEIIATYLYQVLPWTFSDLYVILQRWPAYHAEFLQIIDRHTSRRDGLPREFRTADYCFDLTIDIGGFRDLHRHRRCQQFFKPYGYSTLIFETPQEITAAGAADIFQGAMKHAFQTFHELQASFTPEQAPARLADYILPFGSLMRALFKTDFAEAAYICKIRSQVKGHFSYRRVAARMAEELQRMAPLMARFVDFTPFETVDPLTR